MNNMSIINSLSLHAILWSDKKITVVIKSLDDMTIMETIQYLSSGHSNDHWNMDMNLNNSVVYIYEKR